MKLKSEKDLVGFKGNNVAKFMDSDLRSINLDQLLRVWLSQLIDNALSCSPTYVEIRLYGKGSLGFDVADNGRGYTKQEL
jgi:K+-sensing histidine kinase KdpD